MRAPLFLLAILLAVTVMVDWYILHQSRRRCHNTLWSRLQLWSALLFDGVLLAAIIVPARSGDNDCLLWKMWLLFTFLSTFLPKAIATLFDLIASIPRLFGHKRIKAVTVAGIALAVALCAAMWWGALVNRYRIQIREVDIEIPDLPASFDGFRIVQFSDLHTGTFGNDTSFVSRLTDEINAIHADAIVFTGDIVNRMSAEFEPHAGVMSRLSAPAGVYAILGNHDYGDYMTWDTPDDKKKNMELLYSLFRKTGMRLLLNETIWLRNGNDSIALIGVENIGDPPFPVYGSLAKAYPTPSDSATKILLTHNPAHWVDSISGHPEINIPLTLSGHTHAMQVEVAGYSPAVFRYRTWGGLYADDDDTHRLYVNIGAGTVGYPMRIGATPEITVLTLRRAPEKQ